MIGLLNSLRRDGRLDASALDAFVADHQFPLVDETGVTFIYRGEADEVRLQNWVFGLESEQPLERVADTDLWHLHIELPQGSRIEYKFDVWHNGHNEWIMDPLNPHEASDPFGANSVCQAYGYERPDWTLPRSEVAAGRIDELPIDSRAFGDQRMVHAYRPAQYRATRRYPLLVVHDGTDFHNFGALATVLDNLIHRREIAPMIVAFSKPGRRELEYAGDVRHARHLREELLPALSARYALVEDPAARALLGASFGAVASLHAAWCDPGTWGSLLLLSGSFAFSDIGTHRRGPVFDPVVRFMNEFRSRPGHPATRAYVACGVYESLIYENRSLVPLLQKHGLDVRYTEVHDGHNWENWRDRMRDGLSWVFPGPLWMVYE